MLLPEGSKSKGMAAHIQEIGPWGLASLSRQWSFQVPEGESIKEIKITYGGILESITFILIDNRTGTATFSEHFGGAGVDSYHIVLDAPREYVTQMSGICGEYQDGDDIKRTFVKWIKFHTNLCPDGYGKILDGHRPKRVWPFSSPSVINGSIVGFFGGNTKQYGKSHVGSIGIYVKPDIEKLGPWGNHEALENWSFLLSQGQSIKRINVNHGDVVDGIAFTLMDKSEETTTTMHFGGKGSNESQIVLDCPREYITRISGTQAEHFSTKYKCHIAEMKIHTNLEPDGYGPFGSGSGTKNPSLFSSPPLSGSAIVGFHGSACQHLDSIGIYVKPEREKDLKELKEEFITLSQQVSYAKAELQYYKDQLSSAKAELHSTKRELDHLGEELDCNGHFRNGRTTDHFLEILLGVCQLCAFKGKGKKHSY